MKRRSMIRRAGAAALLAAGLLWGCGCAQKEEKMEMEEKQALYFDTLISIRVPSDRAEELFEGCFAICERIERTFDRTDSGSELYKINHREAAQVEVSEDMAAVIQEGLFFYAYTEGAFDITVAPLLDLWDFRSGSGEIPDPQAIAGALTHVDGSAVHLEGRTLRFDREDIQLDLGALAKGYAADCLGDYLKSQGVDSALINLGGNVLAVGTRPDGQKWKVGIQKPFAQSGTYGQVLEAEDESVVSAGIYERYFEKDGRIYHHLLDVETGYPKETEVSQVTVVGADSLEADALSTACMLTGREGARQLAEAFPEVQILWGSGEGESS